jgi:hypothetical protein
MVSRCVPGPIGLGIDGFHLTILNGRAQYPCRADQGSVPVRQNVQSILLDEERISRQSVLCSFHSHYTLKNGYDPKKMIRLRLESKIIFTEMDFIKIIVFQDGARRIFWVIL